MFRSIARPTRFLSLASLPLCLAAYAIAAQPQATQLQTSDNSSQTSGKPFFIAQAWKIADDGGWDGMTIDPTAQLLYVIRNTSSSGSQASYPPPVLAGHKPPAGKSPAPGRNSESRESGKGSGKESWVQIISLGNGQLVGEMRRFGEASLKSPRHLLLEENGQFGYISDGPANAVYIFDRQTRDGVAAIAAGPNPGPMVYEPVTDRVLVFANDWNPPPDKNTAVSSGKTAVPVERDSQGVGGASTPAAESAVGSGERPVPHWLYRFPDHATQASTTTVTAIDVKTARTIELIDIPGRPGAAVADGRGAVYVSLRDADRIARMDLTSASGPVSSVFSVAPDCRAPGPIAIDPQHGRLFAACSNGVFLVLNADTGERIAAVSLGVVSADALAYDAANGLIFVANGNGAGSLSIVRQSVTDSYSLIQTLPTRAGARRMALDPSTGKVYLAADAQGVSIQQQPGDPPLKPVQAPGSFCVLEVAH